MQPLLDVQNLRVSFLLSSGFWKREFKTLRAVNGVSFSLAEGETLGIVGESGCGKSTLARTIVGLTRPADGKIFYDGNEITHLAEEDRKSIRRRLQMIFQDPYNSLNPRLRISDIVAEGLVLHQLANTKEERRNRVAELLEEVGLKPSHMDRLPHEFSGGQRQRIGIARALAVKPKVLICDEPVSALDVSVQAQIVSLLQELQIKQNLSMLFIGHDLAVVRHISHRIAVMYLGKIVEMGPSSQVIENPLHPYTRALISSVPSMNARRERITLTGDLPSPTLDTIGCSFAGRCSIQQPICNSDAVQLLEATPGHFVACHFPLM